MASTEFKNAKPIKFMVTYGYVGYEISRINIVCKRLGVIDNLGNVYLSCDGVRIELYGKILEIRRSDSDLDNRVFYKVSHKIEKRGLHEVLVYMNDGKSKF